MAIPVEKYIDDYSFFYDITGEAIKVHNKFKPGLDLLVNSNIIVELKVTNGTGPIQRKQLFNYMNITHIPFGMILNFGMARLYHEWYHRDITTGRITRIGQR